MERKLPKVINLANASLSKCEINVLKLGLSFVPTLKNNIPELEVDIFKLITNYD